MLKDQILSELPTVKSVRQKDRRKPSILYCPEACEEDMIHSSLKQNVASEMENTVMIHKTAKLVHKSIIKFAGEKEADAITVSSTRDDVPTDLYSLIRWILVGSEEQLQCIRRLVHQENQSHQIWNLLTLKAYLFFLIMYPYCHVVNRNMGLTRENKNLKWVPQVLLNRTNYLHLVE